MARKQIGPKRASPSAKLNWQDGWFILQDGVVDGPYSSKVTFTKKAKKAGPQKLMVSRKGFEQWYSLQDLADLYRKGKFGSMEAQADLADAERLLADSVTRLTQIHEETKAKATDARKRLVRPKEQVLARTDIDESQRRPSPIPEVVTTSQSQPQSTEPTTVAEEGRATHEVNQGSVDEAKYAQVEAEAVESEQTRVKDEDSARSETTKVRSPAMPSLTKPDIHTYADLAYHHMLACGRLRLGPLLNPVIESLVKFPSSLGIYWGIWARRTALTTLMHLEGKAIKKSIWLLVLALIPGFHLVMAHKLARAILTLEQQNGYQRTSPALATMLALVPPFAIYYMQSALNRHWCLHIENDLRQRYGG